MMHDIYNWAGLFKTGLCNGLSTKDLSLDQENIFAS